MQTLRVLHIDDDLDQLHFTKLFLESYGNSISIDSFDKPLDAFEKLGEKDYDCIISDYQMPKIDGIELTKKIRSNSDIPIIIYTGKGDNHIKNLVLKAGADAYLQKETDPLQYKILYNKMINLITRRKIIKDKY